jgi:hypothetical protein
VLIELMWIPRVQSGKASGNDLPARTGRSGSTLPPRRLPPADEGSSNRRRPPLQPWFPGK